MSLISVIVPVYKVEKYLKRCIESILNQTFTDFDLILVDDGSPDNCPIICDYYKKKDDRIHVIHKKNGGLSSARNTGLKWVFTNSDSEWITFIDSDDWVNSHYLEYLVTVAKKFKVSISMCFYKSVSTYMQEEKIEYAKYTLSSPEELWEKEYGAIVTAWGKLFKRDLLYNFEFPIGKLSEDLFSLPQIYFKQNIIGVINEELYYYYVNNEGIMHSGWNPKKLSMLEAHEKQLNFFKQIKAKKAYKRQLKSYIDCLASHLNAISKDQNFEYNSYIKLLRYKLKKTIIENMLQFKVFSFKCDKWIYEAAFPNIMRLYWKFIAIKNKLNKQWKG